MFEGVVGFSFNIIDNFIMVPVGFGVHRSLEYGLYQYTNRRFNPPRVSEFWVPFGKPDAYKEENWESIFLFEIGISVSPIKWVYLIGTYRLVGFEESNFTFGLGLTIPRKKRQ